MTLARFLAEVLTREGTAIPLECDPIELNMARIVMDPHSVESRALRKATLAVIASQGDMTEAQL
ncbi:MAG: hypothetical protein GEV05_28110 [Betaproteobacteria bacterium]|nr:hypothetical protein [Betaproteobacteria bacterium]